MTDNLLENSKLKMTSKSIASRTSGRNSADALAHVMGRSGSKRSSNRPGTRSSKKDNPRSNLPGGRANDAAEVTSPPQAKLRPSKDPASTLDPAKRSTPPAFRFQKMAEKANAQSKIPDQPGRSSNLVPTPTVTTNGSSGATQLHDIRG